MADCGSVPQVAGPPWRKAPVKRYTLRYLGFLHVAAIQAALFADWIYNYAKESGWPMMERVYSIEMPLKVVVGPVYDMIHDVGVKFLVFADQKVEESVQKLEPRIPPALKNASSVAWSAAGEVRRNGLVNSATGLARYVYTKYEPAAEQAAASLWRSVNRLPLVPLAAHIVLPIAARLTEKYNQTVSYTAEKGYAFSAYLPLVPTERISRVFSGEVTATATAT